MGEDSSHASVLRGPSISTGTLIENGPEGPCRREKSPQRPELGSTHHTVTSCPNKSSKNRWGTLLFIFHVDTGLSSAQTSLSPDGCSLLSVILKKTGINPETDSPSKHTT